MRLKNPYKLIDKANSSFNLYLEIHDKLKEFITSYENNQSNMDNLIKSITDEYAKNHEIYIHNQKEILLLLDNLLKNDYEIKNRLSQIEEVIKDYQNKVINNQNFVKSTLKETFDFFNSDYDICKRYFFNDKENILKNYLDTDELFKMCYFKDIQFLSYSPAENRILLKTKEGIILGTNNRFYTLKEVIAFDGYAIPQFYQFNDFVVFDIGMNRGYSVLRFANFDSCKEVYGFEIDDNTYKIALDNLNLNPLLKDKIKTYNFGLSDEDGEVDLYYLDGCDGLTTTVKSFTNVQNEFKINRSKIKIKKGKVKKASNIILDILKKDNIDSKIVLKIDTEGSEYKIINDLIDNGLITSFDVILGEGHIFSDEEIGDNLLNFGFKKIEKIIYKETYSFCYVKQEHFKLWPVKRNNL